MQNRPKSRATTRLGGELLTPRSLICAGLGLGVVVMVTAVLAQPPQRRNGSTPKNPQNRQEPQNQAQQRRGRTPTLRALDTNRNKVVEKQELTRFLARIPRFQNQPQAGDFIFRQLDADQSGALDARELARFGQLRQQQGQTQNRRRNNGPRVNPFPQYVQLLERNTRTNSAEPANTHSISTQQAEFFEAKIQPVLEAKCYNCHSSAAPQLRGGLRLDMKHGLLTGGESGPAVVPGEPDESPLYLAMIGESYSQMPPREQMPESVLNDFKRWIEAGAPDPRKDSMLFLQKAPSSQVDMEGGKKHWSFQPIRDPKPARSSDDNWSRTDIDRFAWIGMQEAGVSPVKDADRATLLRRVSFDLVGLPPTVNEVDAFVADRRATQQVLAEVVDRLLDSPQFGERWGRHWLDVARFGETSGKDVNFSYPDAWRYRDYVIDSVNADKPYDQFLREQIAGDLLPARSDEQRAEQLIATGYLAVGTRSPNESDLKKFLLENADEQIDSLSRGVLGMTIACARCHDHKFDPIRQSDYYALAGIFTSTETLFGGVRGPQIRQSTQLVSLPTTVDLTDPAPITAERYEDLVERLEEAQTALRDLGPRGQGNQQDFQRATVRVSQISARVDSFNADGSSKLRAMGARDWQASDLPVLVRGDLDKPAEIAPRGFPEILRGDHDSQIRRGSGRLELAEWLTDPEHPLTARVMSNRIWQKLLGTGIVPTSDDFGTTGEAPTHPELLDHLATQFVSNDWSTKSLIRQIVLSRMYQLSADNNADNSETDPDNRWLWRHRPKRLEAEAIRDAMLFASGDLRLDRPVGSAVARFGSAPPRLLQSLISGQDTYRSTAMEMEAANQPRRSFFGGRRPTGASRLNNRANGTLRQLEQFGIYVTLETAFPEQYHRSVYLPVIRGQVDESLSAFDFPDPSLVTGQRDTTTVAPQSLFLLNDTFVIQQADKTAKRLAEEGRTYRERIELAFQWTLGRKPESRELAVAIKFFQDWVDETGNDANSRTEAWSTFVQSLFATAEFRQLD
jgi:hypothetical protein